MVRVGMADLAQQAVQTKPFEQTANATTTPTLQQRSQAPRRQSSQRMLPAQEDLQLLFILLEEGIEASIAAAGLITGGLTQARGILLTSGVILQAASHWL